MRRALAFLTPFGGAYDPSPKALGWFPVVGALMGLVVGTVWWAASKAWPPAAAAAVALASDLVLTGYLHLDGLADAADGLLPPLERARRLDAMADPAVGAFGVVTVAVVLLIRFAAFASAHPQPLVVAALWCGSRSTMAVVARVAPYARPGGTASAFLDTGAEADDGRLEAARPAASQPRRALTVAGTGLVLSLGLLCVSPSARGFGSLAAELVAAASVVLLACRRIGGFTGDVLGAAGVTGETAGLLVLAIK